MAEKFIRRIFDDQVATDGKKTMGILFTKKFERRIFFADTRMAQVLERIESILRFASKEFKSCTRPERRFPKRAKRSTRGMRASMNSIVDIFDCESRD